MKYSPLYEHNPLGPPITLHDRIKAAASLIAVARMVESSALEMSEKDQTAIMKQINRELTEAIGAPWTFVTAMQYLTGQKADKALRRWAEDYAEAGLTPPVIEVLVAIANDFCANGVAGKVLSSGLLVDAFKERPLDPATIERMLQHH